MKERPIIFTGESVRAILAGRKTQTRRVVRDLAKARHLNARGYSACPYGTLGDRLWVREGWGYVDHGGRPTGLPTGLVVYRATGRDYGGAERWRSPIHMPRWASRITLSVTEVRVERLQDIRELDAEAELGVKPYTCGDNAVSAFRQVWDAINAKPGTAWDANPWVWVVSFERMEPA